jgi:hypothetical protein
MSKEELNKEEFFSPHKRFSDSITSNQSFILDRDIDVFGKTLRAGSVIRIIAWREIKGIPYLVISKGTWESLIAYSEIFDLVPKNRQ